MQRIKMILGVICLISTISTIASAQFNNEQNTTKFNKKPVNKFISESQSKVKSNLSVLDLPQGHRGRILSLAYSPDGKMLASSSKDSTIKLWDIEKGQEIATLNGHSGFIFSIALIRRQIFEDTFF